jgi:hypothetical protein
LSALETRKWSIALQVFSKVNIYVPSWGPDPTRESRIHVDAGSLFFLRPDDVFRIGNFVFQIQRDDPLVSVGDTDDVQVKSSGHTDIGATVATETEDQGAQFEVIDLPTDGKPVLSTPDLQFQKPAVTAETIMETPATSRHQNADAKTSPVLSGIDGNAARGHDNSQGREDDAENTDLLSKTRLVSASPNEQTLSDDSPIETLQVEDSDQLPARVPSNPTQTISELETEAQAEIILQWDETNIDTQRNTLARADRLLQTAVGSQGSLSYLPPLSPGASNHVDAPENLEAPEDVTVQSSSQTKLAAPSPAASSHADAPEDPEAANEFTVQLSSEKKLLAPSPADSGPVDPPENHEVPEEVYAQLPSETRPPSPGPVPGSTSTNLKRKRANEEGQDNAKDSVYIEIPPKKKPARAVKTPTKPKSKPAQVGSSKGLGSTEKPMSRSPRGTGMKVLFASSTSIDKSIQPMRFLTSKGVRKAKSVADCDVLCVGKGNLRKTSNLVMAVLGGKRIVTDDWVVQSASRGELLDLDDYIARDPAKEAEWGMNLNEAIQRGRDNVKPLLGWTLHFTTAAKKELGKGLSELKEIALLAGAKAVQVSLPTKSNKGEVSTLIIAAPNDPDLGLLEEGGWRSFSKDIVILSVLRGVLDVSQDEFLVTAKKGETGTATRSKKRKK